MQSVMFGAVLMAVSAVVFLISIVLILSTVDSNATRTQIKHRLIHAAWVGPVGAFGIAIAGAILHCAEC